MTSAPLSINSFTTSKFATGSSTPAECILPAITIPEKCFLASFISSAIWLFVTPVPGLPVRHTKSNPISSIFFSVASEHILPSGIISISSIMSAFRSTGSRLSPTGLPVSFFTSFIGSSDSGRASITGLYTSIPFSSIRSAPKALASSLFVTSPVTLLLPAIFSDNTVLPSLAFIAFFKSWPDILLKSLVKQLSNLFPIFSSSTLKFYLYCFHYRYTSHLSFCQKIVS